ncbi:HEPN domain-containing protein [candidate division KSB3 bacterium]|uniref:HEPN domain-containing protein n=1 Tax=candidate division KSB3 bacterium TaxID=2044937 RepID=A0A9D5JWP5_9BACT|nr:HEPN domain-containing protein [candidate division KSB3 bacterium]MBD3325518.1 HEPN domain-containing protein [candidate division KSB3 bacterium]
MNRLPDELKRQLHAMFQKADRSLRVAQQNVAGGNYDFASSRAYYAAFYAMEAILLTQERSFSSHAAVISAFNQYWVKTGIFPENFGKLISRLFRERQIGDYDYELSITQDDAQQDIEAAQTIINAIKSYLTQQNLFSQNISPD